MKVKVHFNYQVEGTTTVEVDSIEEAEETVKDLFSDGLLSDEPDTNYWDFNILDIEETEENEE